MEGSDLDGTPPTPALEVRPVLLQLLVVGGNSKELVLVIGTHAVPGLWVVLSVPADIRAAKGKPQQVESGTAHAQADEADHWDELQKDQALSGSEVCPVPCSLCPSFSVPFPSLKV